MSKVEEMKRADRLVKDIPDDELRAMVNRLQLEKQLRDLMPKQTSKGKKFVKSITNDIIIPGAMDVGKQMFKSMLVAQVNKRIENEELKVHTNNKKK